MKFRLQSYNKKTNTQNILISFLNLFWGTFLNKLIYNVLYLIR